MQDNRNLFLILGSIFIASMGIGIVLPIVPILVKGTTSTIFAVGLSATLMSISFAMFSFPIGKLIDKYGAKWFLFGGLLLYGTTVFLFPNIRSLWTFYFLRIIEGIGWAGVWMSTETMINQISVPEKRSENMGYYGFAITLGMAAGPIAGESLAKIALSIPFISCLLLSVISAMLVAFNVKNIRLEKVTNISLSYGQIMKRVPLSMNAGFTYGFLESAMISLLPIYLLSINIMDIRLGAVITSFFIGGILFQIPAGFIGSKIGEVKAIFLLGIAFAITIVFAAVTTNFAGLLCIGFFLGAFGGSFYPLGLAILPGKIDKSNLGVANAAFTSSYGMGCIAGPTISSLLMTAISNSFLFWVILPLSVILILMSIFQSQEKSNVKIA